MYEKKNKIALESQVKYCIAAKPNNLLFLQTVCHCYDGDVETVFFFLSLLFLFFPLPCKSFQRLQSPTKKKIFHTESVWVSSRIFARGALDFFLVLSMRCLCLLQTGPNHRCSHSHVLTRLNSILAFNIRTNASMNCPTRDRKKHICVCICIDMYMYTHTHKYIYCKEAFKCRLGNTDSRNELACMIAVNRNGESLKATNLHPNKRKSASVASSNATNTHTAQVFDTLILRLFLSLLY